MATGDDEFMSREGIDILVQTARLWADLGFWRGPGPGAFHIHGVTGPDEYTTVVNDNLYTNVMARYLSLIHISEPTRLGMISYAVFCLKKKKTKQKTIK